MRRISRLWAWTGLLGAAIVVLHSAAGGRLAAPSPGSVHRWGDWLGGRDPVEATFAVTRLAALALAWYLLAVTVAGVALRLVRAGRSVVIVDRLTVRPVRTLLATTVGLGLLTGAGPLIPGRPIRPAAALASVPADRPPPTVTMHRLPDATEAGPTTSPSPPAEVSTWQVRPGQSFWSIATDVLSRARGGPQSDAEVATYWHRLIEANRAALADPGNPDLVFPGQAFTVPPPDGEGPTLPVTS